MLPCLVSQFASPTPSSFSPRPRSSPPDPQVAQTNLIPRTARPLSITQTRNPPADGSLPNRDKLNGSTVTIITAPVGGAFPAMGSDMARVLDDGDNLRVLPVIGKGSVQNLVDIMLLKNIDMGFVVGDALEFVKTEYTVPNIHQRVSPSSNCSATTCIVARKEIKSVRATSPARRSCQAQSPDIFRFGTSSIG